MGKIVNLKEPTERVLKLESDYSELMQVLEGFSGWKEALQQRATAQAMSVPGRKLTLSALHGFSIRCSVGAAKDALKVKPLSHAQ